MIAVYCLVVHPGSHQRNVSDLIDAKIHISQPEAQLICIVTGPAYNRSYQELPIPDLEEANHQQFVSQVLQLLHDLASLILNIRMGLSQDLRVKLTSKTLVRLGSESGPWLRSRNRRLSK